MKRIIEIGEMMTSRFGPARRTGRLLLMDLAVLFLVAPLGACDEAAEVPAIATPAPLPLVTVIGAQPTEVTPGFSFIGRVVAVEKVQLRARVIGFLDRRLFTEGSDVEKGDLLFVIEQTPFEAEVARANAQIARVQASLAQAQVTLRRIQEAVKSGSVSERELDQATAAEQRGQADLLAAKAKLEIAELDLSYTKIYAPITGRIGRSEFSVGNLAGPESGVLATIVSQDPIYVTFPVGQRQLVAHRGKHGDPIVRVTLSDGTLYQHPGKLNFLDIKADLGTDTVTVRAELPNPDRLLVDGQFVGVRVERGAPELVLAVPQVSVQADHTGLYVLVVGADDKVEARRVALGDEVGAQVVIREGLQQGERVIVEGLQKVRPGMLVAVSKAVALPAGQTALLPRSGSIGPERAVKRSTPASSTLPIRTCAKPGIGCADESLAMSRTGAR